MITKVTVNHMEQNYFGDYKEIRSDTMTSISAEKITKAIDKMVRRFKRKNEADCMFFENEDGTGWRLMYDYDEELAGKGIYKKFLILRHYTNMTVGSYDTEYDVSVAYAKQAIIGEEQ